MYTKDSIIEVKSPGFMANTFVFFGLALLVSLLGVWSGFAFLSAYPQVLASTGPLWIVIIAELALAFTAHRWSRTLPMGYWMFALFAFLSGLTLVPILALAGAMGGFTLIFRALIASVATFGAAALYGHVTHRNLLGMGGFLMMGLFGVIIISVIGIFIPWNNTFEIVISGGTILLFAGFTMVDIQMIQRHPGLNPLLAAIMLYINFINIFVSILRLLIALNRR